MVKKQIEVIDMGGKKTVAKKTSIITTTKRVFAIVSVLWIIFIAWFPLYVKNHYSGPIKKSIVVSMFFDLQRNIAKQYYQGADGVLLVCDGCDRKSFEKIEYWLKELKDNKKIAS